MKSFQQEVASTPAEPLTGDLDRDIDRIKSLIKRRLGPCSNKTLRQVVDEVLPYHLWCAHSGVRDGSHATLEYAALSLGEDLRSLV